MKEDIQKRREMKGKSNDIFVDIVGLPPDMLSAGNG